MRPIDVKHLDRQCGGRKDLKAEVLGLFLTETAGTMDLLESESDPAARRMFAHAIRGAALGIGAFTVAQCAAELEVATEPLSSLDLRLAMDDACAEIAHLLRK